MSLAAGPGKTRFKFEHMSGYHMILCINTCHLAQALQQTSPLYSKMSSLPVATEHDLDVRGTLEDGLGSCGEAQGGPSSHDEPMVVVV